MEDKIVNKLKELKIPVDSTYFNTHSVKVDGLNIPIHYFNKKSHSNEVVLVTAGADGDELDGIAAALSLPDILSDMELPFSVVVLPILNPMAFLHESSFTPKDKKFLKHIYPGKNDGSISEKLMYEIHNKFFGKVVTWIDLHGGSKNEKLTPFLYGFETNSKNLNKKTINFFAAEKNFMKVYQQDHRWDKVEKLSNEKIWYLICEAGAEYKLDLDNQKFHIDVVLSLISYISSSVKPRHVDFTRSEIEFVNFPTNTKWNKSLDMLIGTRVERSDVLGKIKWWVFSKRIRAKCSGKILWIRNSSKLETNDTVCAILKN